jgi:hypothetical protein
VQPVTRKRRKQQKPNKTGEPQRKREIVTIGPEKEMIIKGIVDRFEEDYAVIEISTDEGKIYHINVLRVALEKDTKEGDCILQDAFGWHADKTETERLNKEIADLMDDLFID